MGTIKDIVDLTTQLSNSVTDRKIAAELNKIQSLILSLQSEQADIHEVNMKLREELYEFRLKNDALKKEMSDQAGWEDKLSKYWLIKTDGGATVYVYMGQDVPQHYVCPSCTSKKLTEILQDCGDGSGRFICPKCNVKYPINKNNNRPVIMAL
jgi:uncharacterized protein YbaR (Trm112 family)